MSVSNSASGSFVQNKLLMNVQTGVLEFKIIDAKINRANTKFQSQTLFKILYNGNYYRTRPSSNPKDAYGPVWNHQFNIPIYSSQTSLTLTLTSCEDNSVIGECSLTTSQLSEEQGIGRVQWMQMVNSAGECTAAAQIQINYRTQSILGGSIEIGKVQTNQKNVKTR